MCGLHGFIVGSKRNGNADDFMKNGFVAGSLRGMDSSGLALITTSGTSPSYKYQKLPVSGTHFITDKYANSLLLKAANPYTMALGHTRAATSGTIGISEAHPFFVEEEDANGAVRELVGCHNGTLTSWQSKTDAKHYSVDSEWALNRIFDAGLEAFKEISGAFCFVWWDSKDAMTLNFALNDQRDMYVAFTEDDGMAYASEGGMLYWLLERNKVKLKGSVLKLTAGYHYKFTTDKLLEYSKEVLPKPPVATYNNTNYNNNSYNTPHTDKVTALLTRLKAGKSTKPTKPSVRPAEILEAKNHNIMGRKASFIPMSLDSTSGDLIGTAILPNGMEFEAIINNAYDVDIEKSDDWTVNIIGLDTSGIIPTAICSIPYVDNSLTLVN